MFEIRFRGNTVVVVETSETVCIAKPELNKLNMHLLPNPFNITCIIPKMTPPNSGSHPYL